MTISASAAMNIAVTETIAATGINMPPKTTYFFPKIPTGLVFNPLL